MRFVRENRQITNKKLYCEDVLQMLFSNSDSEGEYLRFGNDDRPSKDRASPDTSLLRNGAAGHGESVHKAQTSDHFGPLPNGDGGGRGLNVHRRGSALLMIAPDCAFLIALAQRATDRPYRCSQCRVGLCALPCNKRYHTFKNYKLSPRFLIGQIAVRVLSLRSSVIHSFVTKP